MSIRIVRFHRLFSVQLDGEKGEQFASACAHFIEDQSQALKLIKKKEQSPDFAALMRVKKMMISE